jgi:hypothetical protein
VPGCRSTFRPIGTAQEAVSSASRVPWSEDRSPRVRWRGPAPGARGSRPARTDSPARPDRTTVERDAAPYGRTEPARARWSATRDTRRNVEAPGPSVLRSGAPQREQAPRGSPRKTSTSILGPPPGAGS